MENLNNPVPLVSCSNCIPEPEKLVTYLFCVALAKFLAQTVITDGLVEGFVRFVMLKLFELGEITCVAFVDETTELTISLETLLEIT